MADENILGTPLSVKPPRVVGEVRGAKHEQQDAKWKQVVQQRLEAPPPMPDLTTFGDITTGAITASGAITAPSVATLEADIRHGDRVLEIPAMLAEGTFFVTFALFEASGTNASQLVYTTGVISPHANVPAFIGIIGASGSPPQPTVTGAGLTWVSFAQVVVGGARMSIYRACGPGATPGALTITYGVAPSARCVWVTFELPNAAPGGTDGSASVVESQIAAAATVTLAKFRRMTNVTVGFGYESAITPAPVEAGYTLIGSFGVGTHSIMAEILQDEDLSPSAGGADAFCGLQVQNAMLVLNSWDTRGGYGSLPVALAVGDRIKRVDVQGRHVGAAGTFDATLWKVNKATGAIAKVGATATSASGATADQEISISGLTETVAADTAYWIEWIANTAANDQRCYGASVTYDRLGP